MCSPPDRASPAVSADRRPLSDGEVRGVTREWGGDDWARATRALAVADRSTRVLCPACGAKTTSMREGRESASTTPSRTTHPTGMLGGSRQRHATIGGEERRGLHGSGSGTRAGCTASTANRRLHPRNHRGVHMPSRRRHGAGEVRGAGYMRGSVGGVEQAAPLFNGAPYSRRARLRRPGAVAGAVRL